MRGRANHVQQHSCCHTRVQVELFRQMFNSNDRRVDYDYYTYARSINYSEMTHILRSKAPELVEARTVAPNVRKSHHILNDLNCWIVNKHSFLTI